MNLALLLGITAGVLQIIAFAIYNKQIFCGSSSPNTATWSVWAFLTILNASSYTIMTADVAKYILPIASSLATIGTFTYAMVAGKFRPVDFWGWLVLIFGTVAGLVWWWYQSALFANLIIVGTIAISFLPLYRDVWKNPALEKPLPWYIWTCAYGVIVLVVVMKWNGQYQDFVYPVSMFFLHLVVGLLTHRRVVI